MATEIETMIFGFVSNHFGVDADTLSGETKFVDDLDADSLDIVEMTIQVEEKYDIIIEDEEAEKMETIGDVIAIIEKKKATS